MNVPCYGKATFFDLDDVAEMDFELEWLDEFDDGLERDQEILEFKRRIRIRQLLQDAQVGLKVCAGCPLATRAWCLDEVKPMERAFTGVAGAVAWYHGRRVGGVDWYRGRPPIEVAAA